jgi:hypothetical protein
MRKSLSKLKQCFLWKKRSPDPDDMSKLVEVKTFSDSSHFGRYLVKCPDCGQLYLKEFYEHVDWLHGNDKIYQTWIPIESEIVADEINEQSIIGILQNFPRIQHDTDKDPVWVGRDD